MKRRSAKRQPSERRSRRLLYYGGGLLALVLIAFVVYGLITPKSSTGSTSDAASANKTVAVKMGSLAPDMTFTTVDGTERRLSEFRGRPVMLWLFASWCPTCQAGTIAVAGKFDQLRQAGVQIIQLLLYNNLGYAGPSAEEFAKRYAGSTYPSPGWLWGDASQAGSYMYDPKGYPDIYFLISKDGVLQTMSSAPNVTMKQILAFAQGAGNK
ncbi:MAG TPA: redoxin domain-containing protein [Candidatus Fraserbacteria bacterium]|nr:redoxin domain-containing protein [Candidatus Fraserbacteria bacterium]